MTECRFHKAMSISAVECRAPWTFASPKRPLLPSPHEIAQNSQIQAISSCFRTSQPPNPAKEDRRNLSIAKSSILVASRVVPASQCWFPAASNNGSNSWPTAPKVQFWNHKESGVRRPFNFTSKELPCLNWHQHPATICCVLSPLAPRCHGLAPRVSCSGGSWKVPV